MHDQEKMPDPGNLMDEAKKGDVAAFGKIYDLYFLKVYRYIYFRVRHKEEAEDLTHNVFLKAYEAISRFKKTDTSPLAYFFTVARNTVINFWRKKKEVLLDDPAKTFSDLADDRSDPNESAEINELVRLSRRALRTLTEDQAEIIRLKFLGELSNAEIAPITGKTEEAVRQLQFRGLKSLRRYFKEHGKT